MFRHIISVSCLAFGALLVSLLGALPVSLFGGGSGVESGAIPGVVSGAFPGTFPGVSPWGPSTGTPSALTQERLTSVSEVLASLPSDGCVCAGYNLTVSAPKNAVIKYSGKIWWQNGLFRIEGDGYGIWCDGVHIWTVDSVAGEIVREAAVPIDELIPNTQGKSGGNGMTVRTSPDGRTIKEISFSAKNGTSVSISVPSMTFLPSKPSEYFSYDVNSTPKGFVITELD